jgi:hypothetical protein
MIGNDRKKEMRDMIKEQIKQNGAGRRERKQAAVGSAINREIGDCIFVVDLRSDAPGGGPGSEKVKSDGMSHHTNKSVVPIAARLSATGNLNSHVPSTQFWDGINGEILGFKQQAELSHPSPRLSDIGDSTVNSQTSSIFFSQQLDYETDFIMKYLDYVFPTLFPFYQPAIFETGRSWLLSLLRNSQASFHSALSITSYFFTIAITDAYGDAYADCNRDLWARLEDQINKCFEIVHADMLGLHLRDKMAPALDKVHGIESIIQVLMFEVVIGKSADWNLHLTPAIALFEEVMSSPKSHSSKLVSVLHSIGQPTWHKAEFGHYIWNPDQAGFRFFAALLMFIDVIASTALRQPPRLAPYHSELLSEHDNGAPILGFTYLRLSSVVGCQNSAILAIGQIAALDSWKHSAVRADSLSMTELAERALPIFTVLKSTLDALDSDSTRDHAHVPLSFPFQSYVDRSHASAPTITTTRIWTLAARIYLTVVAVGWQPFHSDIHSDVAHVLKLLSTVPSIHLRVLAWPLCVAGCLASIDQQQSFRDVFASKTKLELLGSLNEARQVMEKVWKIGPTMDPDTWDLVACLSIMEKPVLLI